MPLNFFSSGPISVYGRPFANEIRRSIITELWKKREPMSAIELSKKLRSDVTVIVSELEAMMSSKAIKLIRGQQEELFYVLNMPIISYEDQDKLRNVLEFMADQISKVYMNNFGKLQEVFETTSLAREGWGLKDVEGFINRFIPEKVCSLLIEAGFHELTYKFDEKNFRFWCEETK